MNSTLNKEIPNILLDSSKEAVTNQIIWGVILIAADIALILIFAYSIDFICYICSRLFRDDPVHSNIIATIAISFLYGTGLSLIHAYLYYPLMLSSYVKLAQPDSSYSLLFTYGLTLILNILANASSLGYIRYRTIHLLNSSFGVLYNNSTYRMLVRISCTYVVPFIVFTNFILVWLSFSIALAVFGFTFSFIGIVIYDFLMILAISIYYGIFQDTISPVSGDDYMRLASEYTPLY